MYVEKIMHAVKRYVHNCHYEMLLLMKMSLLCSSLRLVEIEKNDTDSLSTSYMCFYRLN